MGLNTGQKILLTVLLFNPVATALLAWSLWPLSRSAQIFIAAICVVEMLVAAVMLLMFFRKHQG